MSITVPTWRLRDRLLRALDEAGLSVSDMATELGVSRNTVGNYLAGRTQPNRSVLRIWALRCGVPLAWLVAGDESGTATDWVTNHEVANKYAYDVPMLELLVA